MVRHSVVVEAIRVETQVSATMGGGLLVLDPDTQTANASCSGVCMQHNSGPRERRETDRKLSSISRQPIKSTHLFLGGRRDPVGDVRPLVGDSQLLHPVQAVGTVAAGERRDGKGTDLIGWLDLGRRGVIELV